MHLSIVLFVVVLSTVSGQIRLPCLQEIHLHCFSVDSSTVAYKAWLMAAYSVILCEDSSSTLWIRPLFFFVVVLSTFLRADNHNHKKIIIFFLWKTQGPNSIGPLQ